jgi:hypothetical protein
MKKRNLNSSLIYTVSYKIFGFNYIYEQILNFHLHTHAYTNACRNSYTDIVKYKIEYSHYVDGKAMFRFKESFLGISKSIFFLKFLNLIVYT